MNFAKLDDRYDDHRKIKRAWRRNRALVGLHAMAITYCWRHNTDGIVDEEWLIEKLPRAAEREKLLAQMIELGLFDEAGQGHWRVHDYLDFQDSSEKRAARVSAGKRAADARWSATRNATRNAEGNAPPNTEERRGEENKLHPSDAVGASADTATVEQVWTAYVETRQRVLGHRSAPRLSTERRALIARRLKEWPLEDIVDAVQGWQHFPHNRGENDQSTPYCDLKLLLRDAGQIERFRDKQRSTVSGHRESMSSLADRITAAHAGEETEAAA